MVNWRRSAIQLDRTAACTTSGPPPAERRLVHSPSALGSAARNGQPSRSVNNAPSHASGRSRITCQHSGDGRIAGDSETT